MRIEKQNCIQVHENHENSLYELCSRDACIFKHQCQFKRDVCIYGRCSGPKVKKINFNYEKYKQKWNKAQYYFIFLEIFNRSINRILFHCKTFFHSKQT